MTMSDTSRRVELYVRSQAGSGIQGVQRGVVDQLSVFERRGDIDGFELRVWGTEVCPSMPHDGDSFERSTVGRVSRFEQWATENDVSLETAFRHHRIDSAVSGERATVVTLPSLFLAVYEDDRLVDVAPCATGDGVVSIAALLARLDVQAATARHGREGRSPPARAAGAPRADPATGDGPGVDEQTPE
jgi:hypothetical protein